MKRKLSLALAAIVAAAALTGCSGNGKPQVSNEEKVSYTMFAHNWQKYDKAEKDSILKTIEDKFNLELNLTGAPSDGWIEKLTLMVNANEVPDLFFFLPSNPQYKVWAGLGVLLPLDDLVKDTKYVKEIFGNDQYKTTTVNGEHYFVPLISMQNSHAIYYRKDWLDKLGMEEPKTLDEFESMLKAFTENDPDGNGQNDTYGISLSKVSGWLSSLYSTFGVRPGWNKAGDKYEAYYMTDEYKNMLAWLADMYSEGYIQKEYFLNTDQQKLENFYAGKAGLTFANSGSSVDGIVSKVKEANQNAEVDVLAPPDNGKYKGGMAAYGGFYGGWNFASDIESPERAMQMFDFLLSPEGQIMRVYGIEGKHYNVKDGKYSFIDENCIAEPNEVFDSNNGRTNSFYKIGDYFSSCFFKFEDGRIVTSRDYSFREYPDIATKCDNIANRNLNFSDTLNIIDLNEEFTDINSKLNDLSEKYLIMIISGQISADKGISELRAEAEKAGYARAQEIMKETVEAFKGDK